MFIHGKWQDLLHYHILNTNPKKMHSVNIASGTIKGILIFITPCFLLVKDPMSAMCILSNGFIYVIVTR